MKKSNVLAIVLAVVAVSSVATSGSDINAEIVSNSSGFVSGIFTNFADSLSQNFANAIQPLSVDIIETLIKWLS